MKKEYIAPRAAAIRLAMEDTMLTGSKLSTDGSANSDITISDDTYDAHSAQMNVAGTLRTGRRNKYHRYITTLGGGFLTRPPM